MAIAYSTSWNGAEHRCASGRTASQPRLGLRRAAALAVAVSALWSAGCSRPEPAADWLFHGGAILTLDPENPQAQAVAVSGGEIRAVGDLDDLATLRGPQTREVDLAGAVLMPAMVDHHVHLMNVGLALLNADEPLLVDLLGAGSLAEVQRRVRERAAAQPPGSWVLGYGWSQAAWGATVLPDQAPLNEAAADHPVYLSRVDGHAGWANAAALALAGIDAQDADPPCGRILRRDDGTPSGVLLECANEALLAVLPELPEARLAAALRRGAEALAAQGIVEVFDAGFLAPPGIVGLQLDFAHYVDVLQTLDAAAPLPLRINLMVPAPSAFAEAVLAAPQRYAPLSARIGVTHLKLFADGALGSRGAALDAPYADDPATHGVARMSEAELRGLTQRALAAGLGVATHAIGDAAIARTLDVYEAVLREDRALDPARLRIEHFSYSSSTDQRRAAALGIVLSVQPDFVLPDNDGVAMEDRRVGADNAARVYAFRTLLDLGAQLAAGSDYFLAPGPPLLTFHSAVTRQNADGRPPDGWQPAERLSRPQALSLVTTLHPARGGAASAARLVAGRRADLTVLSSNPLQVPAAQLLETQVLATFRDGEPVYVDEALAGVVAPTAGIR